MAFCSLSGLVVGKLIGMMVRTDDEIWGETVAAAIVLRPNSSLDALRAWCRDRIASYKIPRTIHCLDTLPRKTMGKVT